MSTLFVLNGVWHPTRRREEETGEGPKNNGRHYTELFYRAVLQSCSTELLQKLLYMVPQGDLFDNKRQNTAV